MHRGDDRALPPHAEPVGARERFVLRFRRDGAAAPGFVPTPYGRNAPAFTQASSGLPGQEVAYRHSGP